MRLDTSSSPLSSLLLRSPLPFGAREAAASVLFLGPAPLSMALQKRKSCFGRHMNIQGFPPQPIIPGKISHPQARGLAPDHCNETNCWTSFSSQLLFSLSVKKLYRSIGRSTLYKWAEHKAQQSVFYHRMPMDMSRAPACTHCKLQRAQASFRCLSCCVCPPNPEITGNDIMTSYF